MTLQIDPENPPKCEKCGSTKGMVMTMGWGIAWFRCCECKHNTDLYPNA